MSWKRTLPSGAVYPAMTRSIAATVSSSSSNARRASCSASSTNDGSRRLDPPSVSLSPRSVAHSDYASQMAGDLSQRFDGDPLRD